jgi:hypothetical protein
VYSLSLNRNDNHDGEKQKQCVKFEAKIIKAIYYLSLTSSKSKGWAIMNKGQIVV